MTIEVAINDQLVTAFDGQPIVLAAAAAGIEIPTLCWHPDLSVVGSCRLCAVEVEGMHGPVMACSTATTAGMIIRTETPDLIEERREILEMLLADYDDRGHQGTERAETQFDRWCRHYDVRRPDRSTLTPRFPVDSDPNPFVRVDFNQCILCTCCVRACEEVQGRFVWAVAGRGRATRIIAGADTTMLDARCESCGACAAYCPTGALDDRPGFGLGVPDHVVTTTCAYCGVGCQFDLNVKEDRVLRVTSNPQAPVNGLSLCVKGRYGHEFVHHGDRLTRPRVRQYLLDGSPRSADGSRGPWCEVEWEYALDLVADKFSGIHLGSGSDSLAFCSSAKCSNEENYLVQKLARQVFGTHNVDHCARLCHSSTVSGLTMSFGSGAMTNSMDDVAAHAQALFIIGSNTTEQHPVFGAMLRQAVLQRGIPLIVADPRRIDIAEHARVHLRHQPGTDVALINGLMYLVLEEHGEDRAFIETRCENFETFCNGIAKYDPDYVSRITGVAPELLRQTAEIIASHRPMAVIWAMGITQHTTGVMNVRTMCRAPATWAPYPIFFRATSL